MPSAVAGILDRKGGLRVVVTQRWRMRNHLAKGERLFVVPGIEVEEPVPWGSIHALISTVQRHVQKELAPTNHCGGCNACCILPHIRDGDFEKHTGAKCPNCTIGFGCKIYHARPQPCRQFECIWLKSQSRNDQMPPELRPDKCGAFFSEDTLNGDPLIIEVHGEPNADAWRWIDEMQRVGYKAKKIISYE